MTYQVLARKWRPQDFSSLIGQAPIVTALRNALREKRIAQAYIFSGIRGVGKTTAARVLAKALNCETGPAPDPCNECLPCREITIGSDLDVIEVDAATYSKVEQVRDLTESLKYGPARDRYKVVVVDEIHRLSRQAFDALLKIVEEPPAHLVFIFATTEIDAVPATLLSRCQEFHFRRVSAQLVGEHLRFLCEAESIEAGDTALRLIARAGEGSVRDAVALLDQLATFGSGRIDDEEAVRLLGGLDTALYHRLLTAIVEGQSAEVATAAREVEEQGWDPRHIYAQFLAYCRDALHLAMGADPGQIDLPQEDAAALAQLAGGAGYENLLRLLNQLLHSEPTVRRGDAPGLAVEIAWLRAAELPKLVAIEEILAGRSPSRGGGNGPAPGSGGKLPKRSAAAAAPASSRAPESSSAAPRDTPDPQTPVERSNPGPAAAVPETDDRSASPEWRDLAGPLRQLLEEISKRRQSLAAHLAEAEALRFEDGELLVTARAGDHWLEGALRRQNNRQVLEDALQRTWGAGARWRLMEGDVASAAAADAEPAIPPAPEVQAALAHPTVQTVLEIFGGQVQSVAPRPAARED